MNFEQRFAAQFKIQPGKVSLVGRLLAFAFLVGVAFVFAQTAAFALFLTAFEMEDLPYAYLAIAVAVALTSFVYRRLVARLALRPLLLGTLGFLMLGTAAVRYGLMPTETRWLVFALPVWFQVLLNLGNLAFWSLAGRFFDLDQDRRLFGLLGAGHWIAYVASGLLVRPLVTWLGTANLLFLAAASLALGLGVQHRILEMDRPEVDRPDQHRSGTNGGEADGHLLKNRYAGLMFALTAAWWLGFYVLDYIFYDRAAAEFHDAGELASALGLLSALVGILALMTTSLLTGRILGRYGVRAGLLSAPSFLAAAMIAFGVTGTLASTAIILFGLVAVGKIVNAALGFSLQRAAFAILYQPLPASLRLRTQTVVEDIVRPFAIGLSGLLLLLSNELLEFGAVELSYLLLGIVAIWFILAAAVSRAYPAVVSQALARRRFGAAATVPDDRASTALVCRELNSPFPGTVIYAASLLEQSEPEALATVLPALLQHPIAEVRQDALQRIERLGLAALQPVVSQHIAVESSPPVRATALQTLASLGEADVVEQVAPYLDDLDMEVRRGAMVGLISSGGIAGVLAGGQHLLRLIESGAPAERCLAARVLGDVAIRNFYQPLLPLLHDGQLAVRRAALLAAGRVKHPGLWPAVIEALAIRRLRRAATLALVAGGESVVPALTAAFEGAGQRRELQIGVARVCGQLCSERAVAFLQDKIEFPDSAVRSAMLEALSACGYRAPGPVVARVHEQIKTEAAQAAAILADRTEFDDGAQIALLAEILDDQFAQARRRIFFLLTMVYDARSILRVRDALAAGSATQHAYGLELLDTLLPREMKVYLLPLLDELTLEERLQRLSVSFPQARLSREQILHGLITVTAVQHEPWIAASALFTAGQVGVASCRAPATAALRSPHPLVRETAHWTLARLDGRHDEQSEGKGQSRMLSTIEKVLILKGVHIFAETPAEVVADVATIVTEVEIAAGETLFEKGERGDSMYVIVSGKVRVHDGSRTVAELGERQVFGEMALLDPEPRSASVTALEDTQLFRVEAEPFFELIDDRPEVARGIIRVLTGYVRARMRELAALDTRLQEVERDGQKSGERPSAPHLEERLPGARPRTARRPARVDWPARRRHSRG